MEGAARGGVAPRDGAGSGWGRGRGRAGCAADAVRISLGRAGRRLQVAFSLTDTTLLRLYSVTRVGIIGGDENFGMNTMLGGGMNALRLL